MSRKVWKFGPLEPGTPVSYLLPGGSRVGHFAAARDDSLWLWAEVDTSKHEVPYGFVVVGTGWDIPEESAYLGTALVGDFVWHLYGLPLT